jgi:hypothetical protein
MHHISNNVQSTHTPTVTVMGQPCLLVVITMPHSVTNVPTQQRAVLSVQQPPSSNAPRRAVGKGLKGNNLTKRLAVLRAHSLMRPLCPPWSLIHPLIPSQRSPWTHHHHWPAGKRGRQQQGAGNVRFLQMQHAHWDCDSIPGELLPSKGAHCEVHTAHCCCCCCCAVGGVHCCSVVHCRSALHYASTRLLHI